MAHLEGAVRAVAAAPGFIVVVSSRLEPGLTEGREHTNGEGTLLLIPEDHDGAVAAGDTNHLVQDGQRGSD
jgi:hypothetical protein